MYFKDAISLYKNALSVYNVSELNLSTRTYNALYRAKIVTVLDLINSIGENFRGVHHIGDKAKKEIVESKEEIVEKIKKIISDNLPEFNIPVKFVFRESMPLTSINKIDFKKLEQEELSDDIIIDIERKRIK